MATAKYKVHGEVKELTLLHEVSRILDGSLDMRDVVGPVLEALVEYLGMMRGTIAILNRKTGEIQIEAAHGLSDSQKEKGRYRTGEGVTGKVVEKGQPAIVPRISEDPRFLDRTGARKKNQRKKDITFLCVPIKSDKEVIGTLSVDHVYDDMADLDDEVRLLSIIGSMIAQAVRLRQTIAEERQRLLEENERLQNELKERYRPDNIIGNSQAMQSLYDAIAQVAPSSSTVLIRGESGVGKELVAHAIHHASLRSGKPYVKVNCAALPETVLEAELFGHEKGAFTGALTSKPGRFEMADGGTLFLDEVGDFSPTTQVKLLRAIQEREFERVGGTRTIKVDVRIVAATNRNLELLMDDGSFRQDLYYRLNVFPIHIPPLRERKSDILLLADFFVSKYGKQNHKEVRRISTPAIDMLMAYHWPGNVRELENCIERAVLLSSDGVIHGHHLPPSLQTAEESDTITSGTLDELLENYEHEIIIEALKNARGNRAKAARNLGITERIMGLRVNKYDIDPKRFKAQK